MTYIKHYKLESPETNWNGKGAPPDPAEPAPQAPAPTDDSGDESGQANAGKDQLALQKSLPDMISQEPGPNEHARLAAVQLAQQEKRNALLEAASVLLRTLAELPKALTANNVVGMRELISQEVKIYTQLCEQANLRRDHMLAVRYVLCTALDEVASRHKLAGGDQNSTGMWSTNALLTEFHGEGDAGRNVFLLIGRLAGAPDEHVDVLEVIQHVLALDFSGNYRTNSGPKGVDGARTLETIRHRLFSMVSMQRPPVPRELSPHWQGVGQGKFKLLRSIPVWVSASVLGLVLFGEFSWFKYNLLTQGAQVEKGIADLAKLQPPPAERKKVQLNLSQLLSNEIKQGRVKVEETDQRALLTFKGDGMFTNFDQLSPSTLALVQKIAPALQSVDGSIRVIGHTDNVPIKLPQFPSNQVLSEKRAQAVVQVLVGQGVDAKRLQAQGKGDSQPLAPNTNEAGKAQNRRVEIEVLAAGAANASAAAPLAAPASSNAPTTNNNANRSAP